MYTKFSNFWIPYPLFAFKAYCYYKNVPINYMKKYISYNLSEIILFIILEFGLNIILYENNYTVHRSGDWKNTLHNMIKYATICREWNEHDQEIRNESEPAHRCGIKEFRSVIKTHIVLKNCFISLQLHQYTV